MAASRLPDGAGSFGIRALLELPILSLSSHGAGTTTTPASFGVGHEDDPLPGGPTVRRRGPDPGLGAEGRRGEPLQFLRDPLELAAERQPSAEKAAKELKRQGRRKK